ncbi:hypothetical protein VI817_007520 [Penicillium citrinum]|nr:hypothetical protein VI817_007520 [Penicillium citrinum]
MTRSGVAMTPTALLWNFELQREQRSLTQHLIEAKARVVETESLVEQLSSCLKDLTVIVASVATSLNDQTPQGQQRLLLLRSQLQDTVTPIYSNAKNIVNRNEILLASIAKLRGLHHTLGLERAIMKGPPPGLEPNQESGEINEKTCGSSPLTQALLQISHSRSDSHTTNEPEGNNPNKSAEPKILFKEQFSSKLNTMMNQNGRSIGEYFDAAHEFRRQSMRARGVNNDHTIIEAFLAGLDSNLYRRRFTHWLRKEHWTWDFVFHFAQILIMEEEYMAKQEYAMEHKFEDGSVLFPDGERSYRFSYLPPITDEDLTLSECDD